jgi:hypothetical protein
MRVTELTTRVNTLVERFEAEQSEEKQRSVAGCFLSSLLCFLSCFLFFQRPYMHFCCTILRMTMTRTDFALSFRSRNDELSRILEHVVEIGLRGGWAEFEGSPVQLPIVNLAPHRQSATATTAASGSPSDSITVNPTTMNNSPEDSSSTASSRS